MKKPPTIKAPKDGEDTNAAIQTPKGGASKKNAEESKDKKEKGVLKQ